jgi:hypothetical protein
MLAAQPWLRQPAALDYPWRLYFEPHFHPRFVLCRFDQEYVLVYGFAGLKERFSKSSIKLIESWATIGRSRF